MKKCSCCKINKSFTEFHRNRSGKDGYSNYCIECKKLSRNKKIDGERKFILFKEIRNMNIVYEFYNVDNECIYIGQSKEFYARFREHKLRSKFYNEVHKIKCHVLNSFPEMVFHEAQLIIIKQPKYNTRIISAQKSMIEIPILFEIEYDVNGLKLN